MATRKSKTTRRRVGNLMQGITMTSNDHLDLWIERKRRAEENVEIERQTAYDELYEWSSPWKFMIWVISYGIGIIVTYLIWSIIVLSLTLGAGWYTATYLIERFYG